MTTAAAIDRLVHHATIIEMVGQSVCAEEAAERTGATRKRSKKPTAAGDPAGDNYDEKEEQQEGKDNYEKAGAIDKGVKHDWGDVIVVDGCM